MAPYDLMNIEDLLSALSITGLLMYFLIPTFIVIMTVYGIRRLIIKHKIRKRLKLKQKENQNTARKEMEDDNKLRKKIDSLPEEPDNYTKFSSLALEFDEKGQVKV